MLLPSGLSKPANSLLLHAANLPLSSANQEPSPSDPPHTNQLKATQQQPTVAEIKRLQGMAATNTAAPTPPPAAASAAAATALSGAEAARAAADAWNAQQRRSEESSNGRNNGNGSSATATGSFNSCPTASPIIVSSKLASAAPLPDAGPNDGEAAASLQTAAATEQAVKAAVHPPRRSARLGGVKTQLVPEQRSSQLQGGEPPTVEELHKEGTAAAAAAAAATNATSCSASTRGSARTYNRATASKGSVAQMKAQVSSSGAPTTATAAASGLACLPQLPSGSSLMVPKLKAKGEKAQAAPASKATAAGTNRGGYNLMCTYAW